MTLKKREFTPESGSVDTYECGYSLLQCLIDHLIVESECIYKLYYFSIRLFQYGMSLLCDNFGNKFAMNE